MKKLLTIILSVCVCLSLGLVLTACSVNTPEHTHTFETSWSKDATYHWYNCEDVACAEVSQKAEHNFVEDICSVCSYDRSTILSANEVSEEQFNSAISDLSNVTFDYEFNELDGTVNTGKYYIDGNKLKLEINDGVEDFIGIYEVLGNSVNMYVYMNIDEYQGWVKMESDSEYIMYLESVTMIKGALEELSFSDCVYSEGYYNCTNTFFEGTEDEETITFKLQFENGVLISSYITYDDDTYESYVFSNYGSTTVTVPTEYEEFGDIFGDLISDWQNYFIFDNVTVECDETQTIVYNSTPTTPEVITTEQTFKVDGDKWFYVHYNAVKITTKFGDNLPQISYYDLEVYFDGQSTYVSRYDTTQDCYVENQPDENYKSNGEYFFTYVQLLSLNESDFVQESEGFYTADLIDVYGVYQLVDVAITIVDGKISLVEFTVVDESTDMTMTQEFSYAFSSWGETTVEGFPE